MTTVLEVWFNPTGGIDIEPTLLESRPFDPATDQPPSFYRIGETALIAGSVRVVARDGQIVHQVFMVDPNFSQTV